MIHILILVVLVVIAVILAPWLLGLAAVAIAAYGVWLAGIAIAVAIGAVIGLAWAIVSAIRHASPGTEAPPITGERAACPHCQAEVPAQLSRCDNCRQPLR